MRVGDIESSAAVARCDRRANERARTYTDRSIRWLSPLPSDRMRQHRPPVEVAGWAGAESNHRTTDTRKT